METFLFVDNARRTLHFDHGAGQLSSRSFLQREANDTETALFNMFFAFMLYGHKADNSNMNWPIAHGANWCTLWPRCTGVSQKRPFLCIMRNFGYSLLTGMRILVG